MLTKTGPPWRLSTFVEVCGWYGPYYAYTTLRTTLCSKSYFIGSSDLSLLWPFAHNNPWCSCWCQCVVTQPKPRCSCWCQCAVTQPKTWCSCWCQCVVTQPKTWCCCWCQCVVTQPKPWCSCWCQCAVTQPKTWCCCWCQCVVTQPKPWCSCWCQCVVTQPEPRRHVRRNERKRCKRVSRSGPGAGLRWYAIARRFSFVLAHWLSFLFSDCCL